MRQMRQKENTSGYLFNHATGDVWCGSVFGWLPMPSKKALLINKAESLIRMGIEMALGADEAEFDFRECSPEASEACDDFARQKLLPRTK